MSIFSTLNNLKDISLLPEFETLCGISHEEMQTVLKSDIQNFADKNGYTFEQTVKYLKFKYDGYNFSPEMRGVYNPYSVINAMHDKQLNDYWFNSGTPSSLLKLISKFDLQMEDFEGVECSESSNRRYAKAYLDSGKRIVKLAIKFSSKDRNIESYEAVEEKI